jgi:hypothetical protein
LGQASVICSKQFVLFIAGPALSFVIFWAGAIFDSCQYYHKEVDFSGLVLHTPKNLSAGERTWIIAPPIFET